VKIFGPSIGTTWLKRLATVALASISMGCEGSGTNGDGLVIENAPISARCTPVAGFFPSGLDVLSLGSNKAVVVQTSPPGIVVYDIEGKRPRPLVFANIGTDSDLDGLDDDAAIAPIIGFPLEPVMGEIQVLRDDLALVSTSNYEQVLLYNPTDATKVSVFIDVPASIPDDLYPLLPTPGTGELRTGVSTLTCIFPPTPVDSAGNPIGSNAFCDALLPSYLTTLTAGKAVAGGRLFVATSNLNFSGGSFLPGTILVYDWIDLGGTITVRPNTTTPVLFTTGFNPTGVVRIETPGARELVLVTITGAIGAGSGASNILSEASIDVIDPTVPRIAARIPLGRAGPSFGGASVEEGGRIAWVGSSSERKIFAVDLRALDNPALYATTGPPVILDGMSVGFDDARIFAEANPFDLPDRVDGPPDRDCMGFTHVAVNASGSEIFASDFCDGTFTRIRADLTGSPPIPYPSNRFEVAGQSTPFAPNDALGLLRSPSFLSVRPGVPGLDYSGPDVLIVAGQPEAQICALRVESL
jgi:hypothetical protein